MKDVITVARRMGIIFLSAQRNRRATHDELDRLLAHFIDRRQRTPQAMLMHKVIVFALFSTRRQAEITRLTWDDFQKEHKRILGSVPIIRLPPFVRRVIQYLRQRRL
ncbi:hypothetical protein [Pontivivens nitratireducens]|uniref:hypothetical protein n=1 Tax=Pontivivens nitratireducens TaxID=2758038 RepID=UPI0016399116|nr:hypothetical protein [Pontibrevibacter nitratireducens]